MKASGFEAKTPALGAAFECWIRARPTRSSRTPVVALAVVISALIPLKVARGDDECSLLATTIMRTVREAKDPNAAISLAPYAGALVVDVLLKRAQSSADESAFSALFALGLSRDVEALRRLRALPAPSREIPRLGWATGLLALGDPVATGTIARALASSDVSIRRRAAHSLAVLPQKRPRMLLYEALTDPDAEVRLTAAEVHVMLDSRRARRVLVELLRSSDAGQRTRAGRALVRRRLKFAPDELAALPDFLRVQALVAQAIAGKRANPGALRQQAQTGDAITRAAALAVIAATGIDSKGSLARLRMSIPNRRGGAPDAEVLMALALLDESSIDPALEKLGKAEAERAVLVLHGFAAGASPHNQLEPGHATAIAKIVSDWTARKVIDQKTQSLALRALEVADPRAALHAARLRLTGPDGEGLRSAVEIIGRSRQSRGGVGSESQSESESENARGSGIESESGGEASTIVDEGTLASDAPAPASLRATPGAEGWRSLGGALPAVSSRAGGVLAVGRPRSDTAGLRVRPSPGDLKTILALLPKVSPETQITVLVAANQICGAYARGLE